MASTSITSVGRVVVVTQVIPQEEAGMQLQAPPPSNQAPPPPAPSPPADPPAKVDEMTAMFLRGQPHALGVVQIFIGLLCSSFSLSAIIDSQYLLKNSFFSLALLFVVSGSLAVHAGRKTTATAVLVTLLWSVLSALVGVGGVAYTSWLLVSGPISWSLCRAPFHTGLRPSEKMVERCREQTWILDNTEMGGLILLLVLIVLHVAVVVTVCVFSGRALALRRRDTPVVMVQSGGPERCGSDVSLLDHEEMDSP